MVNLKFSKKSLLKVLLLCISGNAFSQIVYTDDFGTSNVANLSSYTGPGGAYGVTATLGNTVDLRTVNPSPNGGAYIFSGFTPAILQLSGSNSYTSPMINVGALTSIVLSFYFRPVSTGIGLGSQQFSVEINTGSGYVTLLPGATMSTFTNGSWSYVVSPVVAVTPGQDVQFRFNSSFNLISLLGQANYSVDLLRVGTLATLPVTHKQFTASTVNGKVKLRWVAMSTQPNAFFEVERSRTINGDFQKLTTIQTACICEQQYQYIDEQPGQTENYYRIKIIDENQKLSYTNVLKVRFSGEYLTVDNIYPTVAAQQINLVIGSDKQRQVTVEILDGNGRRVVTKDLPVYAGSRAYPLDISRLSKGNFILLVRANNLEQTRQFIKQ